MNTPARSSRAANPLTFAALLLVASVLCPPAVAVDLEPGKVVEVPFPETDLPPSLYTLFTGNSAQPTLTFRLPDNYSPDRKYPLLVYVPGFHGGPSGNIGNAQTIAGPYDWVVASLPLFKSNLDREEIGRGVIVSFEDYTTISTAYETILGRLFELVPNLDPERSAMVGFSNGALAIAVLVSGHDEFVLSHFKSFCLVDNGMFHLTDLHKKRARDRRFLVLAGDDKEDMGRDLRIRGGRLLEDSWRLLGVDLEFRVLKDTGHEFRDRQMAIVGRWLRDEEFEEGSFVSIPD
ncbi:MAG: hypothetical protein GY906_15895 [bacterium]|nr:hypothetical protein [bacterium]